MNEAKRRSMTWSTVLFGLSCLSLQAIVTSDALAAGESDKQRLRIFETGLRTAVSIAGQPEERWTLRERMAHWKVPGLSIALIRDGKLRWAKGYGVLQAGRPELVDEETLFSVGSVSKLGAAAVTLRMVDAGKVALDKDVNQYLSRWQVPENPFTAVRPVTLRGILSHTAGFTVHGFDDFQPGATLPSVLDTLEGRTPSQNEAVRVSFVPGSRFSYSGGGITVEQLLIEDVAGVEFPQAARNYVFEPLAMGRSTYVNPVPATLGNIAKAHGDDGEPRALPRGYEAMPEMAASGLWTTPKEFAVLVAALIQSYRGESGALLSTSLARQMMTEVGPSRVGLGPFLRGEGMQRRFFHGGSNDSYNAWVEGHLGTGNGVVIFTNGSNGTQLYMEVRRAVALAEGWDAAFADHVVAPAIKLSTEELQQAEGIYEVLPAAGVVSARNRFEAASYRVVRTATGLLWGEPGDEAGLEQLVAMDSSHFIASDGYSRIEFVRDYAGCVNGMLIRVGDGVMEARKSMAWSRGTCASLNPP